MIHTDRRHYASLSSLSLQARGGRQVRRRRPRPSRRRARRRRQAGVGASKLCRRAELGT